MIESPSSSVPLAPAVLPLDSHLSRAVAFLPSEHGVQTKQGLFNKKERGGEGQPLQTTSAEAGLGPQLSFYCEARWSPSFPANFHPRFRQGPVRASGEKALSLVTEIPPLPSLSFHLLSCSLRGDLPVVSRPICGALCALALSSFV
ncbi:hypothetical protein E2C01_022095 [Portunus trituberculatus]|uniref:Uncharacterized protein n=1 Tax=Portunus trituberculatus TaxID=210409 RepID=A0A5B7E4A3_PORTR|nr:hypothetical protein [Portunus trituberculatus]